MDDSRKINQLEKELQRLKSAVEELTVLNDLAIAASSSMEVEQMLDIIVQKSIKAVKAEQGSILLVTDQQETPLKTLIRQVDVRSRILTYRVGTHITGWVLKHRQPLMIENLSTDKRFQATDQEKAEIRSVLCVPIWFKAKIIGILMVTNKRTAEPFNDNDLRLLSIIAAQSGQLIRNSQLQEEALEKRRLEHELELARKIQMRLIPKEDPNFPELEIASYFNPAEAVGGDYYDYFPLGDHQLGIVMADVSGHGPSAALVMTMVKGILHSITHNFTSANQALYEINSILNRIAPVEMFVTMIFLVFDMQKKVLQFSNAGHNPLLYTNGHAKSFQQVELPGCALNILQGFDYQIKEIPVKPNDLFIIYTDGITEAINDKMEMFETTGLIQALESVVDQSARIIIEHVKDTLHAFSCQTPQSDDIAMIAVKIRGNDPSF